MKKIMLLSLVPLIAFGGLSGCTSSTDQPSTKPTISSEGAQRLRGQFVPGYDLNSLRDYSSENVPDIAPKSADSSAKASQEEEKRLIDSETFDNVILVVEEAEAELIRQHEADPGHYGAALDGLGEDMYVAVQDNLPRNEGFEWSFAATDDGKYIVRGWNQAGWAYTSDATALVFSTEKGGFVYRDTETKK